MPLKVQKPGFFALLSTRSLRIWDMYKAAISSFWTVYAVDSISDMDSLSVRWDVDLDDDQRYLFGMALVILLPARMGRSHIVGSLYSDLELFEARCFLAFQTMSEDIHHSAISEFLLELLTDYDEMDRISTVISNGYSSQRIADWTALWTTDLPDKKSPLSERLIVLVVTKWIFRSAAHAVLASPEIDDLLPDLAHAVAMMSSSNKTHAEFACDLFKATQPKPTKERVLQIVLQAVELEKDMALELLKVDAINISEAEIMEYIEFMADMALRWLGFKEHFESCNPFMFTPCMVGQGRAYSGDDDIFMFKCMWNTFDNDGSLIIKQGVFPYVHFREL